MKIPSPISLLFHSHYLYFECVCLLLELAVEFFVELRLHLQFLEFFGFLLLMVFILLRFGVDS